MHVLAQKKDVNGARLGWLSLSLVKPIERNADSSEMASSGMVAFLAVGRGIPTQRENDCSNDSFLWRTLRQIFRAL